MKRTLSFLLALALFLSLVPGFSLAEEEPLKVTVFMVSSRVVSEQAQTTLDYIKDKFNIEMEYILANDNWQQKYALLISANNVPTISFLPHANFYQYAGEGAYKPLTGKLDGYENIMNYVPETMWPRLQYEGELYGIPNLNTAGKYNIVYRQDWLNKLNLAVPTTIDEFTEVMRAFTEDDPDGNGLKDTYGFGTNNLNMFYGAFGGAPGFYKKNADGQIEIGSISDGYKAALEYYAMLYQKGYVEPEALTQQNEQFWQKFTQNKIGSYVGWWSWLHGAKDTYGSDAELVCPEPVTGPAGQGMIAADPLSSVAAISYQVTDEQLPRVLELIDFALSDYGYRLMKYGMEGIYHTLGADGKMDWYYNFDPEDKNKEGVVTGDMEVYCMFQRMDIYPEQIIDPNSLSDEGFTQAMNNPLYTNDFLGLTSEAYQNKMADIDKYVEEARIKFIMGDMSFDNWDQYVAEYIRLGGLEVAESLLVEYNKMYNDNATLVNYQ